MRALVLVPQGAHGGDPRVRRGGWGLTLAMPGRGPVPACPDPRRQPGRAGRPGLGAGGLAKAIGGLARVGRRRQPLAVRDHAVGDSRQFVGGDEFLPGASQEQGRIRQAHRDRGVRVIEEGQVGLQAVTVQALGQPGDLAQQRSEFPRPLTVRPLIVILDDGQDPARVEQDVHQPAAAVQPPPHPVVGPPGTLVERREVVQVHAAEFAGGVLRRQGRPGVGADLDELHRLVDPGIGGLQGTLSDHEVEQQVRHQGGIGRQRAGSAASSGSAASARRGDSGGRSQVAEVRLQRVSRVAP